MPTISVDKNALFRELGREYTTEEFDELCFEFGIELDEDTSTSERPIVNGVQEPPQLKIEIPANRYDMLCFEGIALMLNIFNGRKSLPNYRLAAPVNGEFQTITVAEDTTRIRPYVSGAILRNITLDKARYDSFISLQDKLHQNLARQRTLVSIGTHDLDSLKGPFTYEALPPEEISFVPLNQKKEMNGAELMKFYETDRHLGRYLPIIRDSPVYPVIYDADRVVCSLPPIINGNHSKVSPATRNVFIEVTATDRTKLEVVINIVVAMFAGYCDEPFAVEPVKAAVSYINACCGLTLTPREICAGLKRMAYLANPSSTSPDLLDVHVPPTRADVLHQADIMEDAAIAHGFNRLPRAFPASSGATVGAPLPVNKLADVVRLEACAAGWTEVLPLILCSHDENFAWLNRADPGGLAVRLANPKTAEYQIARTSLLPGLLKTLRENKHRALPLKVFEASDVVLQDAGRERRARNERRFAAAWCGKSSGFEVVHGLLDRVMLMLRCAFVTKEDGLEGNSATGYTSYWIEELDDPTYFPGHAASVHVKINEQETVIGSFGILHPTVLECFELRYPVSALELNIEVFL